MSLNLTIWSSFLVHFIFQDPKSTVVFEKSFSMSRQKLGLELSIGDITILLLKSLYYYLEEFVVC